MLSPAWPSSSSFLNISTPVTTFFCVVAQAHDLDLPRPTFTFPRSTRPVATVPRPEIVKMSSIGIRNGLSISRCGSGM